MTRFVKLHRATSSTEDRQPIYVNPDHISYMYGIKGGTHIIFSCSAHKEHQFQSLNVLESLESIINLIALS